MKIIPQKELLSWLNNIAGEQKLIAPTLVADTVLYRPVKDSSQIQWDYTLPILSAKEALFPSTERLLTIEKRQDEIQLSENLPQGEQVIFGIRPCDVQGILALDALFLDTEPQDDTYAQRRKDTTLVGLACEEMKGTCFCTSLGSSPHDATGMDIMLTKVASGYAVEVLTDKGADLLQDLELDPFEGELPDPPQPIQDVPNPESIPWVEHFEDAFWEETAERCLSCRMCAYVCPVCRCFDVRDELLAEEDHLKKFERIRAWDSCMREDYRTIAGDHNPRAEKKTRLRNRILCKFHYYPEQYGVMACTGCGRCIDACPVNIDLAEIISTMAQGERV